MNVEGDFRYVNPGGFDECIHFLEYLDECEGNWDDAFLNWVNVCGRHKKEYYKASTNGDWGPWSFVKVYKNLVVDGQINHLHVVTPLQNRFECVLLYGIKTLFFFLIH